MSDIEEIASRTGAEIGRAYRAGEADPVAVTECLLSRIAAAEGDHIFITVSADRALAEAKAASRRHKEGRPLSALDGVPIAWKDLFDVAGTPTTAGSLVFGRDTKARDLACVSHAAAAGLVTMGKVNMSELAYSGLGLNPHFGTPRNPNDKATLRSPGGSSSGSGAAVGARLVPLAIGSDTGGSVRIPAAFNGVVGFKTSTGRIEADGIVPLARTYDTIGPLARSVEDCVLVDMALRGAVATEVRRAETAALTVLVPTNIVLDGVSDAVAANFERTLGALSAAGVTVRHAHVDALHAILALNAAHGTLTAAEAYTEYREIVDGEKGRSIDRRVTKRIMDGKRMSAHDVLTIQRERRRLITAFENQLGDAILVMPTTPITAPAVAPLEADDDLFHKVNLTALRNTMLGNILDLCGVAVPNGRDGDGLPTSILFSAPHGADERLLGVALAVEGIVADAAAR